jgi:hypothetical protein
MRSRDQVSLPYRTPPSRVDRMSRRVKVHASTLFEHWLGLRSLRSRPVPAETYETGTASMLYGAMPARPWRMNAIASTGSMVS